MTDAQIIRPAFNAKPREVTRSENNDFGDLADRFGTAANEVRHELGVLALLHEPELCAIHRHRAKDAISAATRELEIASNFLNHSTDGA